MSSIHYTPYSRMELPVTSFFGTGSGKKKSTGSSSSHDDDDSGGAPAAPALPDREIIRGHVKNMFSAYEGTRYIYTPESESSIKSRIASSLRPAYDLAIAKRKELTDAYHAELDADALSRGMGSSTYVSDVKARQKDNEARDIGTLESEYGAKFSEAYSNAWENEKDRALEADILNAESEQDAYMAAYQAALSLFTMYKQGSPGVIANDATESAEEGGTGTAESYESYLAGLSAADRETLYAGRTEEAKKLRGELIESVGALNFLYLQQQYPAS